MGHCDCHANWDCGARNPETERRTRAYRALQHAAEQIGRTNRPTGVYSRRGYSITPEHRLIVEAMPAVLSGSLSINDAMALLHEPDVMRQRFGH